MKITHLVITMLILSNMACKNDDNDPIDPVDELPPATQIGAQTFGCLVDGKPFKPGRFGQNVLSAFFQNIEGKYFLGISAPSSEGESLSIQAWAVGNLEEKTYSLQSKTDENFFATYTKGLITTPESYLDTVTSNTNPGKLTITNYDQEKFIISGTFEFTVIDNEGKDINITDGRFDMNFTN